jgi:MSHA pilin protein MshD
MTRVRDRAGCSRPFERGLTLIELLVFIVIIGIAANAMLAVFANLTRTSAGLLPDKQAQAIAASMMNEVMAQPFTFCDPDSPNAGTAATATAAACGGPHENNLVPEGETRNGASPFDNVNDYNSAALLAVSSPNQFPATGVTPVAGLPGYTYQVTVAPTALPNVTVTPNDALRITVTVRLNGAVRAQLDGVRIRYAPKT